MNRMELVEAVPVQIVVNGFRVDAVIRSYDDPYRLERIITADALGLQRTITISKRELYRYVGINAQDWHSRELLGLLVKEIETRLSGSSVVGVSTTILIDELHRRYGDVVLPLRDELIMLGEVV